MASIKDDVLEYRILNWDKYNPKTKAKNLSWVRLDVGFFDNPDVMRMSPTGVNMFLFLLTQGTRRAGTGREHVLRVTRACSIRSRTRLIECMNALQDAGMLEAKIINLAVDKPKKAPNERNERNGTNGTVDNQKQPTKKASIKSQKQPTDGSKVFEAYASAYFGRYNQQPVRNAKTNALCSQLVKRLGAEDAPFVAAYYVDHPGSFYVRSMHQLDWLVKDAEKVCTEWKAGAHMTGIRANQIEERSHGQSVIQNILKNTKGPSDE